MLTPTPDVTAAVALVQRAKQATDAATKLAILEPLTLDECRHPLLDDARKLFASSAPTVHKESTKAAGVTIYELRDREGAACRGGMWLDGDTGWLVYADKHDSFHSTAASYFKTGKWEPGALDRDLAAREAVRRGVDRWRCATLTALIDELTRQLLLGRAPSPVTIKDLGEDAQCQVSFAVERDTVDATPASAHQVNAIIGVHVTIRTLDYDLRAEIVSLVSLLQHDEAELAAAYVTDGIEMSLMVTYADLAQLTAQISDTQGTRPPDGTPVPTHLHWVARPDIVEGLVMGRAARALCGQWFVPTRGESAPLPVCETCEQTHPIAQDFLNALRSNPASM